MDANQTAIQKLYEDLTAQRDAILAESTPLRDQRDALQKQIHPLEEQSRDIAAKFLEIEKPLHGLSKQITALAVALGGKTLAANVVTVSDAETAAAAVNAA